MDSIFQKPFIPYQAFTKEEAELELDKLEGRWEKATPLYLNLGAVNGRIFDHLLSVLRGHQKGCLHHEYR
jgi:hypothetical protein